MRKTIQLTHPRHKPERAVDAVKNSLRKYLKRERGKKLPEGADYWDFDCRIGLSEESAEETPPKLLIKKLDLLASEGAAAVYVEILAKPGVRTKKPEEDEE